MIKKFLRIALIFLGILSRQYYILSRTGGFKVYSNTTSNLSTLELNSKRVASNLIEPKIGDFVCYKSQNGRSGIIRELINFPYWKMKL